VLGGAPPDVVERLTRRARARRDGYDTRRRRSRNSGSGRCGRRGGGRRGGCRSCTIELWALTLNGPLDVGTRDATAGTVILDPPRTGLSREALAALIDFAAPRLIYVSCDVATLARDARRLVDSGYTLHRADAFDLFPNTPHVETVVVFER